MSRSSRRPGISRRAVLKAGAAAAAAAAVGFPAATGRAQAKEILIGETHPLTGGFAREGNLGRMGIELAVDEINQGGGIKSLGGARLKLMVLDNESKPPVGISTMEKLKDAGAVAVLGPYASGLAFVTTQEAEKYKIPHVLDVAIADQITERGFRYTFRLAPTASMGARSTVDSLQAMVRAAGLSARRVALMHEDGIFGKTTADTLQKLLPPAGFEVVERMPHPASTTSLTSDVLRLKSARADILIPSTYYGPHGMLLRTVAEQRVDLQAILSVYGGAGSQYRFIGDVGRLSEYMLDGNHWYNPKHPRVKGLIDAFQRRFNQPFAYEWLLAYVSAQVLRDALERAGSTDRERLRDALAATNLRDAVVPYAIAFDAKGQNAGARTLVMQVLKGHIAVVHPTEYAEAAAVLPMPRWSERG